MALFKINRGSVKNLPTTKTEGYMYITEDVGDIYVDLSASKRIRLNSEAAERIRKITYNADGSYKSEVSLDYDDIMTKDNPTGTGSLSLNRKSETTIGDYSTTIGYSNTASGVQSFAIGGSTEATGIRSFAAGLNSIASEESAIAIGYGTTASGLGAFAANTYTTASKTGSAAFGIGTIADTNGQLALGSYNIADSNYEYIEIVGNGTGETKSQRSNAYTLDKSGNAWFAGDVYVGSTSGTNKDDGSVKLAKEILANKTTAGLSKLYVANDCDNYTSDDGGCTPAAVKKAVNKFSLKAGGEVSGGHIYLTGAKSSSSTGNTTQLIFGTSSNEHVAITSNTNMIVINPDSKSTNNQILLNLNASSQFPKGITGNLTGTASRATADASGNVITSTYMTKANPTGTGALSLNRKANTTIGSDSIAIGTNTTSSGEASYAEGANTTSSGWASHAEGRDTTASGYHSHAEGYNTYATSYASHAEGAAAHASGQYSHAEGSGTTASAENSHAEGDNTIAAGYAQHVQGKYNVENATLAHIVGNGTYDTPSNAHVLDWEGNAWFAGNVYVGSADGAQMDPKSKKLATEEYVTAAIGNAIAASY